MPLSWLLLILAGLTVAGFWLGRRRALHDAGGDVRALHSLPVYYGANVALSALVAASGVLVLWLIAQPLVIDARVAASLGEAAIGDSTRALVMTDVRRLAEGLELARARGLDPAALQAADMGDLMSTLGLALGSEISPEALEAARRYAALSRTGQLLMTIAVLGVALAGFFWALRESRADFRARTRVESGVLVLLAAGASIAVLTTLGIILSLVFNTIEFLRLYPASEFFFGTTWQPSFGGGSELGILPLLWGTLYISVIALAVSVPIGIFAAIYLAEYATPAVRGIAKPLLEVLAGIPTIVYGLFALLTVGPLLMQIFGDDGLGWMQAGTAVMTAGLVMGIMLIPFVSSLSDDIINAVPQALRDGSYGLGATKSETIRQVVLPAALPGIVGAVLLAASRAIGETMIVVLGAGAAARLSMNPFDAMTTVTAKIVSQLTGDADFASPEALVAFALGMTLFVITLGLNVIALWVVRRYREQYE